MQRFEYKVVPAPKRGEKARGVKRTEDRFAHGLTVLMNDLGREGWEYVRADTLPCEERVGFTGRTTTFQHMLVFRRVLADAPVQSAPAAVAAGAAASAGVVIAAPAPAAAMPEARAGLFAVPDPEPANLPDIDPMDEAARRAALIPLVTRQTGGPSPRLTAVPETGLAPTVGPARGPGHAAE